MMRIDVIQYVRPHGIQRPIYIENMPDDLQPYVDAMKEDGVRIAVEELVTGEVSFTLENWRKGEDVDIELCANGPGDDGTRASLEKLIRRYKGA